MQFRHHISAESLCDPRQRLSVRTLPRPMRAKSFRILLRESELMRGSFVVAQFWNGFAARYLLIDGLNFLRFRGQSPSG